MTPAEEKEKEKREQESAFAAIGQQVLNNEAYKQAMMLRKAQIFELFCKTAQDQPEIREECWRTMVNINALEDYFKTILDTGKLADITLELMKEE